MVERQPAEARLGTTLKGKWTLERVVGVGGMATVYAARHAIGRLDAIKILHPAVARDPVIRSRFEQEARAVNRFRHPGAVEIRDIDIGEDGTPFLVMELLAGESLLARARRLGGIELDEMLRIVDDLLDVLASAHDEQIIHRDIKLDNLFITEPGALKVLDFGIARVGTDATRVQLTRTGATVGTVAYMSPEQVGRGSVDARSDLFAVGAVMFRLVAQRRIHEADSEAELLVKMATLPAPPLASVAPSCPESVCRVVDRALAFDRARRYSDARSMQQDVRAVRQGKAPLVALAMLDDDALTERDRTGGDLVDEGVTQPSMDEDAALVGITIDGRYVLESFIGRGGMGAVYGARDADGRPCAVKVLSQLWMGVLSSARERIVREARAAQEIDSEHVVKVLAAGTDAGASAVGNTPFIVMELLQGLDLERLLARAGALEPMVAARLFLQASRGVAAAHERGIVHRDIKPGNLFICIDDSGRTKVKVCDLGLAKSLAPERAGPSLTTSGSALGTPAYLSPEQAKNAKDVDERADVWSLCISLREALTGERPWPDCHAHGELIVAICTTTPAPLSERAPWVAPALARIVERGLVSEPAERWRNAGELADALAKLCEGALEVREEELVGRKGRGPDADGSAEAPTRSLRSTDGHEQSLPAIEEPLAEVPHTPPRVWHRGAIAAGVIALSAGALWWAAATPTPAPAVGPAEGSGTLPARDAPLPETPPRAANAREEEAASSTPRTASDTSPPTRPSAERSASHRGARHPAPAASSSTAPPVEPPPAATSSGASDEPPLRDKWGK